MTEAFLRRVISRSKHGPEGSGRRGDCADDCVKCEAEQLLRVLQATSASEAVRDCGFVVIGADGALVRTKGPDKTAAVRVYHQEKKARSLAAHHKGAVHLTMIGPRVWPLAEDPPLCGHRDDCANNAEEPHTCPYSEDINGDRETLCTCCNSCRNECSMDI